MKVTRKVNRSRRIVLIAMPCGLGFAAVLFMLLPGKLDWIAAATLVLVISFSVLVTLEAVRNVARALDGVPDYDARY